MNQAQRIFEELMKDYLRIGIPLKEHIISPRLQYHKHLTHLGTCKWDGKKYTIYLSEYAMEDEDQIRKTLAHELIHTLPGCMNHGSRFHKWGSLVENKLGIRIDSRATKEDAKTSGIDDAYRQNAKYKIVCQGCGLVSYRQKKSNLVSDASKYRCGKCGGVLKAYTMNEQEEIIKTSKKPSKVYAVKCMQCGARIERRTMSSVIKKPSNYRCRCGGYLMRIL